MQSTTKPTKITCLLVIKIMMRKYILKNNKNMLFFQKSKDTLRYTINIKNKAIVG